MSYLSEPLLPQFWEGKVMERLTELYWTIISGETLKIKKKKTTLNKDDTRKKVRLKNRGPFLESPDNFSGPESYFMRAMFAWKTQILFVLKAEQ